MAIESDGEVAFEDFIGELQRSLPSLTEKIRDEAERVSNGMVTESFGALTDTVMAENQEADERGLQVLAAHAGQVRTGKISRRDFLGTWLPLTLSAIGAASGGAGIYATYDAAKNSSTRQRETDAWKLSPALVIQIAHNYAKRPALQKLHNEIKGSMPNEAFLIESIFDHGSGFDLVYSNLSRLENLLRHGSADIDTSAFVARKFASDYVYLGLTKQARDIFSPTNIALVSDRALRFQLVEMRYTTMLPLSIEASSRRSATVDEFGASLRADCASLINVEIDTCTNEDYELLIRTVSCEAVEPIGLYYRWLFFRSADEKDAEQYFENMLRMSGALVKCAKEVSPTNDYAFREAWWHLARLLPFAYFRGFHGLANRIVLACEGSDPRHTPFPAGQLKTFHRDELKFFRSPVFVNYTLIRSLQEYEKRKDVSYFRKSFIQNKRYRQLSNAVLQKSIASVGALVDENDRDANRYASLTSVDEGSIMMMCIKKAHGRA
jgi:hypothetical protein